MLPTRRVVPVASRPAMRDVESATAAPGAPKPSVKKMCLVFSIVIMIWFAVLVYIISGVKAPDRQSYYMDNLDFKASSVATPSSHAHPHPNLDCRAAGLLATTHTLTLTLASPLVLAGRRHRQHLRGGDGERVLQALRGARELPGVHVRQERARLLAQGRGVHVQAQLEHGEWRDQLYTCGAAPELGGQRQLQRLRWRHALPRVGPGGGARA